MNDLDTIAINDMRHELCDISPCYSCSTYEVLHTPSGIVLFYGTWEQADAYLIEKWQLWPPIANKVYNGLVVRPIEHMTITERERADRFDTKLSEYLDN